MTTNLRDRIARALRDPNAFPAYHLRALATVWPVIARSLRHPTRNTPGIIRHAIWWWCSDIGWSAAWRPACWIRRYHTPHHCDAYFEMCITCGKPLWSRSRNGSPNPYRGTGRAPLRRLPRTEPTP